MRVEAPVGDCPKCGYLNAFIHDSPRYRERSWTVERPTKTYDDHHWEEFLAWPCRRCGFEMETPVLG